MYFFCHQAQSGQGGRSGQISSYLSHQVNRGLVGQLRRECQLFKDKESSLYIGLHTAQGCRIKLNTTEPIHLVVPSSVIIQPIHA